MKSRKTERTKEKYEGEENRREDMRGCGRECVRKELREMRKMLEAVIEMREKWRREIEFEERDRNKK